MAIVRMGQLGQLKQDKIEEYKRLHAAVWPDILKLISDCNLRNYSIFLLGDKVFAYFEYIGEDYDADMAKMEADPLNKEWWKLTNPCFERFAISPESEFYHDMEPIFYTE